MSDSFTETTSVSWFGRIKRSVGAVVIGLVLIVAMVVLLFWNEGRAVTTARSLDEGAAAVVSVDASGIDAAHEGKLVHVSGPVTTDAIPADPDFGIEAKGIRLVRKRRDVPVERGVQVRDPEEAGRGRGNRHHLYLLQDVGRPADQLRRLSRSPMAMPTPT